jgi:predicted ATPase/DNA-binding XRE family transcriptional regulator
MLSARVGIIRRRDLIQKVIQSTHALVLDPVNDDGRYIHRLAAASKRKKVWMMLETSFGHWLMLRRRALRLSCVELARRVGCATVTLHKIEADERRPSRQIAVKLAEHLAVAAQEQETFIRAARGELSSDRLPAPNQPLHDPAHRSRAARSTDLPIPPTPLIGRATEVTAVRELLLSTDVHLLTLIGAPGIGKTRLALEVAADVANGQDGHRFADGVYFISLAPIRDPGLVISTIAQALEVGAITGRTVLEGLQAYLRDRHILLVLDNFEQVLKAAPQLAALLAVAARLTLLVTSRVALHLSGEHRFAVPPLALPDVQRLTAAPDLASDLVQYAAVELFVERAWSAAPSFALTDANALAVATICAHLDGLPLAIELAAARMGLFAPQELLARPDHRLSLLTEGAVDMPTRQQTLRRAIAWSYDLLDAPEQALFRRLGVFVGGCTLEAAERVANAVGDLGIEVLDGVTALMDNSLLQREQGTDGRSRFTMLETIREYALERLEESGEYEAVRRHHAVYYRALAEAAEQAWDQPHEVEWLQRLVAVRHNLRAALQWALDIGEAEFVWRLNGALFSFWIYCSSLRESDDWLERALARQGEQHTPAATAAKAKLLTTAGYPAVLQGDYARAQARFEHGLALYAQLGDQRGIAWSLRGCGFVAMLRGDLAQAETYDEQSLALCRETQDMWGVAWSLYGLAYLILAQGDMARAHGLLEEALARFREQGIMFGVFRALLALGFIILNQGQIARAAELYREGLMLGRQLRFQQFIPDALEGLAGVAVTHGQPERAARLYGTAETLREALGTPRWLVYQTSYERTLVIARAQLDNQAWGAAWAVGRAMPLTQAVAYALED